MRWRSSARSRRVRRRRLWRNGDRPYTAERIAHIDAIEAEVKHDVIAFLTELAEQVGPEGPFRPPGADILGRSGYLFSPSSSAGRATCCWTTWTGCWPPSNAAPKSTNTP